MAKCKKSSVVLLGFEDELVTEKHKSNVGYWSNKIGGFPNWPVEGISSPNCQLCGLVEPLVAQIYAPLENSPYHRTLYVFSCINPNCWNHNESWTCLRSQLLDSEYEVTTPATVNNKSATDWGTGADDWDDDNGNFENGNIKPTNQFSPSDNESDEDSSSLSAGIGNLNVDEFNANYGSLEKSSGAVGKQLPPVATAEIEKEENEVVSIDTPTAPQKDLIALLQETAPVPFYLRSAERNQNNSVSFVSFFISVGEESNGGCGSDHIRELLVEYHRNHGDVVHNGISQGDGPEDYEKAVPAHGDKMFHHFLSRIQSNPGQILRITIHHPPGAFNNFCDTIIVFPYSRYSREAEPPLLLYPLQEQPRRCNHCNGEMIFEMQLLPTLISKLRFPDEDETRVEFGTVLIYTCRQSCWSSEEKFREEKIIVQVEKT